MNDEEKEKVAQEIKATWTLPGVEVTRVITTGWGEAGHPFTIGPRHVSLAADKYGGMLGAEVMEKIGCAHPRCGQKPDAHKETRGLLVTLTQDVEEKPLAQQLEATKPVLAKHGIEGWAFDGIKTHKVVRDDGTILLGPGSKKG